MRVWLTVLFVAWSAVPIHGAPITWRAESEVSRINDPFGLLEGLTVGTPWSLEVTFDPTGPATPVGPGCNSFAVGATTFVLGGFTYTRSSGSVFTNSALPGNACPGDMPNTPLGMVQFAWFGDWTQEPGAWNLNLSPNALFAGYYDQNAGDGSLPTFPVYAPVQGDWGGLKYEGLFQFVSFSSSFQPSLVENPVPIPEPATVTLFGLGLAALARQRLRRR